MKKLLITLTMLLSLVGCSLSNTPTSQVEAYLDNYNNLTEDVVADLDTTVSAENLNDENKSIYKEILTRQYKNLKYEVKDEIIDGDNATVNVQITVYDLYSVDKSSQEYMNQNVGIFNDENNIFDNDSYNNYKLNEMLKTNDTVNYDVTFNLEKKDNEWVIQNPDRVTLEKLHGLYNYEND